ncbi:hypothetical protein [Streptomyces sp. NPDC002082]|uniref:hypothetical protein n=1 Tax=Streptomyces sp. NPDC002082 TaxID=3154772 RepID=UPI00332107B2
MSTPPSPDQIPPQPSAQSAYGYPQPGWPAAPAWPPPQQPPKRWPTSAKVVTGLAAGALVIGGTVLVTVNLTSGGESTTAAPAPATSSTTPQATIPAVPTVVPSPVRTYSAYDEMKAREVWQELGETSRKKTCDTYKVANRTKMIEVIGTSLYKVNGITADPGALYDLVIVKECGSATGV